jgi:hypothetical protein
MSDRKFHTDPEVVPGLLRHGVTLLTGRGHAGKSWLALHLAVAVAGGCRGQVLGLQAPVLYLAHEDTASRLHHRLKQLAPVGDPPLTFGLHWPLLDEGGLAELAAEILGSPQRPRLVVVDTLTSALSHGIRRDPGRLVMLLEQLYVLSAANRLALLLVDRHSYPTVRGRADAIDKALAEASRRRLFDRTLCLTRRFGEARAELAVEGCIQPIVLPKLPDLPALGSGGPAHLYGAH